MHTTATNSTQQSWIWHVLTVLAQWHSRVCGQLVYQGHVVMSQHTTAASWRRSLRMTNDCRVWKPKLVESEHHCILLPMQLLHFLLGWCNATQIPSGGRRLYSVHSTIAWCEKDGGVGECIPVTKGPTVSIEQQIHPWCWFASKVALAACVLHNISERCACPFENEWLVEDLHEELNSSSHPLPAPPTPWPYETSLAYLYLYVIVHFKNFDIHSTRNK